MKKFDGLVKSFRAGMGGAPLWKAGLYLAAVVVAVFAFTRR